MPVTNVYRYFSPARRWLGAFLLVCAGFLAQGATNNTRSLPDAVILGEPAVPTWTWERLGDTGLFFRVVIPGIQDSPVSGGHVFTMPGQAHPGPAGSPRLPRIAAVQELPAGQARLELRRVAWTDVTNVDVSPVEGRILNDVTNGFQKKTRATPQREIELARKRQREVEEQQ